MFDTVNFWLPVNDDPAMIEKNLSSLTEQQETVDRHTGSIMQKGKSRNLSVWAGERGVYVRGSLAKHFFGDNAHVLSRRSTQDAITELSDLLHLSMASARICRLDVANNLIMKHPVADYTSRFADVRYLKKAVYDHGQTVKFSNSMKTIQVYDKKAELQKGREPIPDLFQNRNVLRFEYQFKKRLGKQFNAQYVQGSDLYDEVFYMRSLEHWKQGYFLIQKVKKGAALSMSNVKDYLRSLAYYGLQNIGYDEAMSILESGKKQGLIDKQNYYRLKKVTQEISLQKRGESEDLIAELDHKVVQAVAGYR